jgi:hypothetical protein
MANRPQPLLKQRTAYFRARCQAQWRYEHWDLTWEQWWQLWEPHWQLRGRGAYDLCMQRIDREQGWFMGNVEIAQRIKYLGKTPRSREQNSKPRHLRQKWQRPC